MTADLSRLEGTFIPVKRRWQATLMQTPTDVDYLKQHARGITFGPAPDAVSIRFRTFRLAETVFLEEIDHEGARTGRWELVPRNEFGNHFAHIDDLQYEYGLRHKDPDSTVFVYQDKAEALETRSASGDGFLFLRRTPAGEWEETS